MSNSNKVPKILSLISLKTSRCKTGVDKQFPGVAPSIHSPVHDQQSALEEVISMRILEWYMNNFSRWWE